MTVAIVILGLLAVMFAAELRHRHGVALLCLLAVVAALPYALGGES